MDHDRRKEVRELRLEGVGIVVVGSVLVLALTGTFLAGRWYERRAHGTAGLPGSESGPLANVVEAPQEADVDASANYFDILGGSGKEAEPQREIEAAQADPAGDQPAGAASAAPDAAAGRFYVQVFAGRDRRSAEGLVNELRAGSFEVRLFSEREGQNGLYRVRVGGYPTREDAARAAQLLLKQGYKGAFVTIVEPEGAAG